MDNPAQWMQGEGATSWPEKAAPTYPLSNRKVKSHFSPNRLPPLIDKCAFTYPVTDKAIQKTLNEWLDVDHNQYSEIQSERLQSNTYRRGRKFRLSPGKWLVAVQCRPYQTGYRYLRVEFNPSNPKAVECWEWVKAELESILYEPLQANDLVMTRVDFALDHENLYPHWVMIDGARVSRVITRADGELQTIYRGAESSDNHYRVYDKRAELAKDTKQYSATPLTRFEHVFQPNGGVSFADLYAVEPFKRLKVNLFPDDNDVPKTISRGEWLCILDSIQMRGVSAVLAGYQDEPLKYKAITKKLRSRISDWWNPDPVQFHPALDRLRGLLCDSV
jgi:hypothetical protein